MVNIAVFKNLIKWRRDLKLTDFWLENVLKFQKFERFFFEIFFIFEIFFFRKFFWKFQVKNLNYIFMLKWSIRMDCFGVNWGKMLADWFWNGSNDWPANRRIYRPCFTGRNTLLFQSWITCLVLELLILLVDWFLSELLSRVSPFYRASSR